MINMKMSPKEAKEYTEPSASEAPEYPYGLSIDLSDESLAKLGITDLPKVGAEMVINARVVVTSTSSYETQGGEPDKRVCLQITDMELAGAPSGAAAVYSQSKMNP